MIDSKTILHIANLSRLSLSSEELGEYSHQLSKALEYFDQVSKVPTENVEPLVTPTEIEDAWRSDEVLKELTLEEILENAPQKLGNLFTVPPVV